MDTDLILLASDWFYPDTWEGIKYVASAAVFVAATAAVIATVAVVATVTAPVVVGALVAGAVAGAVTYVGMGYFDPKGDGDTEPPTKESTVEILDEAPPEPPPISTEEEEEEKNPDPPPPVLPPKEHTINLKISFKPRTDILNPNAASDNKSPGSQPFTVLIQRDNEKAIEINAKNMDDFSAQVEAQLNDLKKADTEKDAYRYDVKIYMVPFPGLNAKDVLASLCKKLFPQAIIKDDKANKFTVSDTSLDSSDNKAEEKQTVESPPASNAKEENHD